jgi:hypothetical protein
MARSSNATYREFEMKKNKSQVLLELIGKIKPTEKTAEQMLLEAIQERQLQLDPSKFTKKKVVIK